MINLKRGIDKAKDFFFFKKRIGDLRIYIYGSKTSLSWISIRLKCVGLQRGYHQDLGKSNEWKPCHPLLFI